MRYYRQDEALLDRRAFALPDLYDREMSRVFAASWVFVGPAEWVSKLGSFFTSRAGHAPFVVWRGPAGGLHLFANSCPRCIRALAPASRGEATTFACPCSPRHYGETDIRRHLATGQLDTFGGLLVAAQLEAAPFLEWIGDFAPYLHRLAQVRVIGETALRWQAACNWKLAVESACGVACDAAEDDGFQVATAAGVAVLSDGSSGGVAADGLPELTPLAGALFPNLTFEHAAAAMHLWSPLAPDLTEVQSFCIAPASAGAREIEQCRRKFMLTLGAGDAARARRADAWRAITRAASAAPRRPLWLNVSAGRESERRHNLPGLRGALAGETNARAFYAWWQDRLDAPSPSRPSFAPACALHLGGPR